MITTTYVNSKPKFITYRTREQKQPRAKSSRKKRMVPLVRKHKNMRRALKRHNRQKSFRCKNKQLYGGGLLRGYVEQWNGAIFVGTCATFVKELVIKVNSGEQFGISFKGTVKTHFWE